MKALVLAFRPGQQVGEDLLGPLIAFGGIDSERADNRLRHWDGDVAIPVAHRDGAIGLIQDDVLEPLLIKGRAFVLRSLRSPARIAGLTRLKRVSTGGLP
jgi:hypothetical protein